MTVDGIFGLVSWCGSVAKANYSSVLTLLQHSQSLHLFWWRNSHSYLRIWTLNVPSPSLWWVWWASSSLPSSSALWFSQSPLFFETLPQMPPCTNPRHSHPSCKSHKLYEVATYFFIVALLGIKGQLFSPFYPTPFV